MDRDRVAEQVGAVAEDRDDQPVGRGELGAERRADAPAEAGGRARPEIAARQVRAAMLEHQRVFVDDDRVLGLGPPMQWLTQAGWIGRCVAGLSRGLLPAGALRFAQLGDPPPALGDSGRPSPCRSSAAPSSGSAARLRR